MSVTTIPEILADIQKQRWVPETLAYSNTEYGRIFVCVYSLHADEPVVMFKAQTYERKAGFSEPMYYDNFRQALIAIGVPQA